MPAAEHVFVNIEADGSQAVAELRRAERHVQSLTRETRRAAQAMQELRYSPIDLGWKLAIVVWVVVDLIEKL